MTEKAATSRARLALVKWMFSNTNEIEQFQYEPLDAYIEGVCGWMLPNPIVGLFGNENATVRAS